MYRGFLKSKRQKPVSLGNWPASSHSAHRFFLWCNLAILVKLLSIFKVAVKKKKVWVNPCYKVMYLWKVTYLYFIFKYMCFSTVNCTDSRLYFVCLDTRRQSCLSINGDKRFVHNSVVLQIESGAINSSFNYYFASCLAAAAATAALFYHASFHRDLMPSFPR